MSGTVIPLSSRQPYMEGNCVCLACGHKWAGTSPIGVYELECPRCGCIKGVWGAWVVRGTDYMVWICGSCECDLFRVNPNGIYCANCGNYQNFNFEDE